MIERFERRIVLFLSIGVYQWIRHLRGRLKTHELVHERQKLLVISWSVNY